jgi:hypothetical protein
MKILEKCCFLSKIVFPTISQTQEYYQKLGQSTNVTPYVMINLDNKETDFYS